MTAQQTPGKYSSKGPFGLAIVLLVFIFGMIVMRATEPPKTTVPTGLDATALVIPEDNQMNPNKIALGHLLYFDKRLSPDNTIACATCHDPAFGFTDGKPVSTGINGQQGGRSAPTVINRVFTTTQFWDGRAASLEEQAKGPLTNPIEHGFGNAEEVVLKVGSIPGYGQLFRKVFGSEISMDNIAKAIAAFERTVISGNSAFDKYQAGDKAAMTEEQIRGMELFNGKARCSSCHSGFNFSDESFHNLGVGMASANPDLGRYIVTKNDDDKGAFKTPTLRDITKTGPYMHDGSQKTLEEVVHFYNVGGHPNESLSPLIEPLGLTNEEEKAVVAFMGALEGEGWQNISQPTDLPK